MIRGAGLKRHLTQFALVLLFPLIVLVGLFFWQLVLNERSLLENQTLNNTQALTIVVDREVSGLQNAAEILGHSLALKTGALHDFQKSIHDMGVELKIRITLYDAQAKLLVTSEPLLVNEMPLLEKADLEKAGSLTKPYITGVAQAHAASPYYFTAVRPVLIDGAVKYYLGLSMDTRRIDDLLTLSGISTQWIIAVIDQNGRILTRNKTPDDYVGRFAPDSLRQQTTSIQGRWHGATLDGTEILGFYTRSVLSDWHVVVAVNRSEFNQPFWNVLGYFVFLVIGTICLTAVLAGFFGRRISTPVKKLAAQALAIGGSRPVAPLYSGIRELDLVSEALIKADERRRKKETRLHEAQLRLQMALDTGRVGVWEYDPETLELKLDSRTSQMLAFDGKLRAQFNTDFLPSIHTEDRLRVEASFKHVLTTGEIVRETFRICDQERKNFVWVIGNGRRIYSDEGKLTVLGLIANVTVEQLAIEQREVVAQELNHRLKNMFAVIISLMNLSARGKTDIQDYVRHMRERMTALATAFELTYQKSTLEQSRDATVSLNDLLARLARPYAFSDLERILIEGDELPCPAAHITSMSLVFHELVTNSVKHGALSVPQGHVKIVLSKHDTYMLIVWSEINGPEITQEPSHHGFGTRLKQLSIDVQMQGAFKENWHRHGLVCTIRLPYPGAAAIKN